MLTRLSGAGCAGVCATLCEGTRARSTPSTCAHGRMCGSRARTVTVAEQPAAPVGPQQRVGVDDEEQPEQPQVLRVGGG